MARLSVPIHELAQEHLRELKRALEEEKGQPASNSTIVSALIFGTTLPQASGMLTEFNSNLARAATDSGDDPDDAE